MKLRPATYSALIKAAKRLRIYDALAASPRLRGMRERLLHPPHPMLPVIGRLADLGLRPPVLMDIGARGGVQPIWKPIAPWIEVIGFEPDAAECERLNARFRADGDNIRVYPVALSDTDGEKPFFVTAFPNSSGLFAADPAFIARLQEVNARSHTVVSQERLATRSIDSFLSEHPGLRVDFIKIDVEGAEYEVLAGARDLLAAGGVLGVEYEVWVGPIKHRADRQARIDELLRESRLHLFDLTMRRYPRKTFPDGFIPDAADLHKHNYRRAVNERYGQHLTGDAVYLRDPVWEHGKGITGFRWDDDTVVRMALIYSLYDLPDCAIELVQHYARHFESRLPLAEIEDALTPPGPGGRRLSYRDYLAETARRHARAGDRKY